MEGKRRGKEVGRVAGALARWPPLAEELMRTQCKQNIQYLRCPRRMLAAFCDDYQYRYQSRPISTSHLRDITALNARAFSVRFQKILHVQLNKTTVSRKQSFCGVFG